MTDDYVAQRYAHLRRTAFLMCGDWSRAGERARTTLARALTDPDVGDLDLWAYADLMAGFKPTHGRREHVFVAPEPSPQPNPQPAPEPRRGPSADRSPEQGQEPDAESAAAAYEDFTAPGDAGYADADLALRDTYTVLVLDALRRLPPKCRAVLVLHHFCHLAVGETADVLGLDGNKVTEYEAEGLAAFAGLLRVGAQPVAGR